MIKDACFQEESVSVLSWNVWGLKRKLCDVEFLDYVNQYDILLLGETWLNEKSNIECSINGFECEHLFARKSLGAKMVDIVGE